MAETAHRQIVCQQSIVRQFIIPEAISSSSTSTLEAVILTPLSLSFTRE
jgi:hypothetical protein